MRAPIFAALQAARVAKRATALATELATGAQALVVDGVVSGELALDEAVLAEIRRRIVRDRGGVIEGTGLFVETFAPPLRLAIIGAVHIAQALAPIASLTGYEVTVIDPRRAFSSDERFPGVAFQPNDILLFGRESAGAPAEVHDAADLRLRIPLQAGLRSLNVATAAAMVLSEALRQTSGFDALAD